MRRNEMQLVKSFCCFFSTKVGCAVIGTAEVGVAVPSLYYICRTTIDLFLIDKLIEEETKEENANLGMLRSWINLQFIFFLVLGIFLVLHVIAVGLMVRGAFTGVPSMLVPWLAMSIYRLASGVVICSVIWAKAPFWSERITQSINKADMDYYAKFVTWLKVQYPCCSSPSMEQVLRMEALFCSVALLVSTYFIVVVVSHYKVLIGLHHHMAVIADLTRPSGQFQKLSYRPPKRRSSVNPIGVNSSTSPSLERF